MKRRNLLQLIAGGAAASILNLGALSSQGVAQTRKSMGVVVKTAGVPWFNLLNQGLEEAGRDFNIETTMLGPTQPDPAQQVRLIDDLIARKVDAIGLVPLDVKVTAQALKRAQDAGIPVITQEGLNQDYKSWDLALMSAKNYGETQMKAFAREMGEEGDYVVYVGTLTTAGHNQWADAAIAYQKEHYPNMNMITDRLPGADLVDASAKVTQDVLQAYPSLKGILCMGSNGPIGAGNVVRQRQMQDKIIIVGTVIPSQARAMIMSGVIREGFLWSPLDAGYGMVALARMVLDGEKIEGTITLPKLGEGQVDLQNKVVELDRILTINKDTIDDIIKLGL